MKYYWLTLVAVLVSAAAMAVTFGTSPGLTVAYAMVEQKSGPKWSTQ